MGVLRALKEKDSSRDIEASRNMEGGARDNPLLILLLILGWIGGFTLSAREDAAGIRYGVVKEESARVDCNRKGLKGEGVR